jgi:hypothetical protein
LVLRTLELQPLHGVGISVVSKKAELKKAFTAMDQVLAEEP